jgi:hypothetical protein
MKAIPALFPRFASRRTKSEPHRGQTVLDTELSMGADKLLGKLRFIIFANRFPSTSSI